MSSRPQSSRVPEVPGYHRIAGDDGTAAVSATERAHGRRLRNWIILANVGAWIVLLAALKWLMS